MHLHHVGIATREATSLIRTYEAFLDLEVVHEEQVDDLDVTFLALGGTYLEVLEPRTETGPVASYLADNGPGIHHLAIAHHDVPSALSRAREAGIELIDSEPRPGAWGHEVAFLHPRDTGGVLLEFVQSEGH